MIHFNIISFHFKINFILISSQFPINFNFKNFLKKPRPCVVLLKMGRLWVSSSQPPLRCLRRRNLKPTKTEQCISLKRLLDTANSLRSPATKYNMLVTLCCMPDHDGNIVTCFLTGTWSCTWGHNPLPGSCWS